MNFQFLLLLETTAVFDFQGCCVTGKIKGNISVWESEGIKQKIFRLVKFFFSKGFFLIRTKLMYMIL